MAIDSYLNLITSQHRNKPNFIAWLSAALNKVDDGMTATNSIPSAFSINGAKLGTTNLVKNSGFEVATTTATLFSDALTSYSGSTVPAPWTLQSGSFTFGASGATSGANGSFMSAGNPNWRPVLGSDGSSNLTLKAQATYVQPATVGYMGAFLMDATNANHYQAYVAGGSLVLEKKANGGTASTLTSVAFTASASTSYSMSLQFDHTGALVATVTPSGGATTTLNYTDSSPLTVGLMQGVGGDTGVVISNASVTAPWANSWTISGDSRVAWGLTQSAISGKYSVNGVGLHGVSSGVEFTPSISASTQYTFSAYMETSNVGSGGAIVYMYANGVYVSASVVTGTTLTQRYSGTVTPGSSSGTTGVFLAIYDSGTVTFDNIQLEQGTTATPYIENYSLSYPASTYSDQLNVIGQSIGADRDVGIQLSTGTSILDDAHYQTYLNAKISANQWDGTTPGLYKIWSSIFPGSSLKITDNQDMTISLTISGITDSVVEEMINDGLIIPKPMGVKISSITFGTVLIYNKLDTQTWNTVQTYTWDQLEMQSF